MATLAEALPRTAGNQGADRQRLLTEAAVRRSGIDGLAEVGRRPGPHQPTTYLARIDAPVEAGR